MLLLSAWGTDGFSVTHHHGSIKNRQSIRQPLALFSAPDKTEQQKTLLNQKIATAADSRGGGDGNDLASQNNDPKSGLRKYGVLATALGSVGSVSLLATQGIIPGYAAATTDVVFKDVGVTCLSGALAYAFIKTISLLASKKILKPRDSRKLIHTFSIPLYIVLWPLFSDGARFFAACVPLINAVRLYLAGTGAPDESELANAVSRSGDSQEAVGGPFIYVVILFASVLLWWRNSMAGIMALSIMAAGDGMADLVGRRFGKTNKWSFSPDKSVAGSAAFVLAGTLCATGLATWLSATGCLASPGSLAELVTRIAGITTVCAMVELLPFGDDNWTVPISAAILSTIVFR